MIILFNLNKYVGGGEILTIRLAQYFKDNNVKYTLFSFEVDCYISEQAKKRELNITYWPQSEDSIAYMNQNQKEVLIRGLKDLFDSEDNLYSFTFCLRDLYNSLYIFTRLGVKNIRFSTGIYHPEDVNYLSSFSFDKSKIIIFNRSLLESMTQKNSVLYINRNALITSLGREVDSKLPFIPIPIPLPDVIPMKEFGNRNQIKIVCISRFVDFKIAAVLAIIRFVRKNKNFELTLIGYGIYKFVLLLYMKMYGMQNVKIYSGIGPDQLDGLIDQADIGYAQGTSILEIAKRGMPVIIAPYSKVLDIFDPSFKCMGVFGEQDDYNFGDYTSNGGPESVSIESTIAKILNDYQHHRTLTVSHTQKFSVDVICQQMHAFIINSQYQPNGTTFTPPNGPLFKKALRKLFKIVGIKH